MADTTISGLSPATPNKGSAIIPFSDGSTTYKTSPSGIVAASPGCMIQMVKSTDADYIAQIVNTAGQGTNTWVPGLSATITPRSTTSTIMMHIDAYVLLYASNTTRSIRSCMEGTESRETMQCCMMSLPMGIQAPEWEEHHIMEVIHTKRRVSN